MKLAVVVVLCAATAQALSRDNWANVPNPCKNNPQNIVYFAHPRDTSKFIQCDAMGQMYIIQCPENTIFSSATRSCVAPVTTAAPVKTDGSNPCTAQNLAAGNNYFAIKNDPSHFIECGPDGLVNILPCPDRLVWDETRYSCVYKSTLAGGARPTSSTGDLTSAGLKNPCDGQHITANHSLFFSHPDPSKFIECGIAGDAYVLTCPSGLIWNQYNTTCVSPYASSLVIQGN
ncbi:hypothetical protein FSP39_008215 [Pinctada imbricata]|uniref:Chitin-binding type-2 domain-containing protein n=1 Tax=Pinctada imbricata TaxID=66713 RepID=A0AA88YCA4_PINIB|nr:hypothetical protein FSP39_008215 [Pinctada imbricata]